MGFSLSGALSGGIGGFLAGGPWGGLAGAALGGFAGGEAEDQRQAAADAAARGQQASIAESRRQFDITRQDLAPFLERGNIAGQRVLDLLNQPSPLPGLQDLATKQALRRGSVAGNVGTGAFVKDLTRGLADVQQGFTNQRINQLLALSGRGQSAGTNLGTFGANMAQNVGQGMVNIGNTQAGLNIGRANSIDNLLNQAAYAAPFIFRPSSNIGPQTGFSAGGAGFYG